VSARALQRVVVRMHHDPALVAAVYADAGAALEALDLTPAERDLLTVPDRRAWGVDPARRDRVFEAVRREYPVTCALAQISVGARGPLLGFFSSPEFHRAVQSRRAITPAFGAWIEGSARAGRFGKKPTAEVARLESATVEVRRAVDVPPGERWVRAPWIRVVDASPGALELYQAVFASLRASSTVPSSLPRVGRGVTRVVVERNAAHEVVLGSVSAPLAGLLRRAEAPVAASLLHDAARELGAEPGDEPTILASLHADRLLVRCP